MTDNWQIREAKSGEQWTLLRMVAANQLNLLDVQWQNFIVIVDDTDHIVGCGQIKHYGSVTELASLVVDDAQRGKGLSRKLMQALLARAGRPVWLACESLLVALYEAYGFREEKQPDVLPPHFLAAYWASRTVFSPVFFTRGTYLTFMVLES